MQMIDKIDKYLEKMEEKKNKKESFLYTTEDLDKIELDVDTKKRLIEAGKVFVSAYWSGNVLKWRTEDGRTGSDPMKKTKNKKIIQKHMEKVLGSPVDLELLKEGLIEAKKRKVGGREYDEFFTKMLKKWKIKSYKDLPKSKQKAFFDEVDAKWNAKKETD